MTACIVYATFVSRAASPQVQSHHEAIICTLVRVQRGVYLEQNACTIYLLYIRIPGDHGVVYTQHSECCGRLLLLAEDLFARELWLFCSRGGCGVEVHTWVLKFLALDYIYLERNRAWSSGGEGEKDDVDERATFSPSMYRTFRSLYIQEPVASRVGPTLQLSRNICVGMCGSSPFLNPHSTQQSQVLLP